MVCEITEKGEITVLRRIEEIEKNLPRKMELFQKRKREDLGCHNGLIDRSKEPRRAASEDRSIGLVRGRMNDE